jgi:hypothetical protein
LPSFVHPARQCRRRITCARLKVIALLGLELQLFAKGARQRPRGVRHDQLERLLEADPKLATLWLAGRRAVR